HEHREVPVAEVGHDHAGPVVVADRLAERDPAPAQSDVHRVTGEHHGAVRRSEHERHGQLDGDPRRRAGVPDGRPAHRALAASAAVTKRTRRSWSRWAIFSNRSPITACAGRYHWTIVGSTKSWSSQRSTTTMRSPDSGRMPTTRAEMPPPLMSRVT